MSELEFRTVIRNAIVAVGSLRDAAKKWNVSPAHLSDCVNGRRAPGPVVLNVFGYEKVVTVEYQKVVPS